jgi:hypothetical protein
MGRAYELLSRLRRGIKGHEIQASGVSTNDDGSKEAERKLHLNSKLWMVFDA